MHTTSRHEDVQIHASGRDRAYTSARWFLAGLLADSSSEEKQNHDEAEEEESSQEAKKSCDADESTTPICSLPISEDWIMRATKACPKTMK